MMLNCVGSVKGNKSDRQLNRFSACIIFRRDSQLIKVIMEPKPTFTKRGANLCRQVKAYRNSLGIQTYLFDGLTSSTRRSNACRKGVAVDAVEEDFKRS